jgi:hypothetical protein
MKRMVSLSIGHNYAVCEIIRQHDQKAKQKQKRNEHNQINTILLSGEVPLLGEKGKRNAIRPFPSVYRIRL